MTEKRPPDLIGDDDENLRNTGDVSGVPALDTERYREYVDDFDLSEEKKKELLETLWWIMATFVDLGFGVDSVQRCLPALAEITLESEEDAVQDDNGKPAPDACSTHSVKDD